MGPPVIAFYTLLLFLHAGISPAPELLAAVSEEAHTPTEAAVIVAVISRESGGIVDAVNPGRTSFCAMQIETSRAHGAELLADPRACVREGAGMLRASADACSYLPTSERLAVYARGRCDSERGRSLSRDRMALAGRLERAAGRSFHRFFPWGFL